MKLDKLGLWSSFKGRPDPFFAVFFFLILPFWVSGCATIFGWEIHAPGVLSDSYFERVSPVNSRVALILSDRLTQFTSEERGGRFADPQTYFIGEAFTPMAIEGFQQAFEEFVFVEVEPTPELMKEYAIAYLAAVDVNQFHNRVTLKGQAVGMETIVRVFNPDLELIATFDAKGSSDAQKVFAKKGGPQVNLNAAIENNILSTVEYMQDLVLAR